MTALVTTTQRVNALVDRLAGASRRWLAPNMPAATPLPAALDTGRSRWPGAWDQSSPAETGLLFPLRYTDRPALTTMTFHHLVDAVCEARRGASTVDLLAVPTGRSGPTPGSAQVVTRIARAAANEGLPVRALGDLADLVNIGPVLVSKTCRASYTRRATDLPDLLVAAAAQATGTEWVYLGDGLRPGRQLQAMRVCPPLSRLHDPVDPFAPPPPYAKQPPAGTNAVWAAAFTLGLEDAAMPPLDRPSMTQQLVSRLGPLWRAFNRQGLVRRHGLDPVHESPRLRLVDHDPGQPLVVPLFGSPVVSESSRTLVRAAALAGPVTIVVDDLTPRFSYRHFPVDAVHARYRQLAASAHATVRFLSTLPDVSDRLDDTAHRLTFGHVMTAARNRHLRRRGGLTGYDAIHLTVMATCAAAISGTVVVTASNLPAIRAVVNILPVRSTLAWSGTTAPTEVDWKSLAIPANLLNASS